MAILTTSVICVAICQNAIPVEPKTNGGNSQVASQEKPLSDIHFIPAAAIDGLTADGFEFSSEGFKSSDGVGVSVSRQYCRTPENAERALAQRVKNATTILQQNTLVDEGGKQIGRRVVASFDDHESKSGPAILWTKGNTFFTVESSSIKHALLMEEKVLHDEAHPSF